MPNIVLFKDGSISEDEYVMIGEDGRLPMGNVLLRASELDRLSEVQGKKALLVTVDSSPEDHQFPLDQLDMIAVEFAAFTDGRGYSYAALLRRQGFVGELRAVGDVFKDMLNYLKRVSFDSFILKQGKDINEAISGLNTFTAPYQASVAVPDSHYQTGSN
ncbi:DUF934 domain-containing protein [Alkanindiges sp. WGS2144]|uniref:DUF934 domain-containing protein n=1 Tax=Alkanindiges sp. WGS2144 TaxID=3366808 RepID=UPI003751B317